MRSRGPARSRAGLLLGFLAVVVVVSSVIGTLAATGRFARHSVGGIGTGILNGTLKIDTMRSAHLYCPSAPSFSPDGSMLAVLGTGENCTDSSSVLPGENQHKLAIYNVNTGLLEQVLELDHFFQPGIISSCAGVTLRALLFTGLGWSPDGKHFGVLYAAFDTSTAFSVDEEVCSGLLLLSVDASTAVDVNGDAGFFDAATGTYAGFPVWNLSQLTTLPPQAVAPALVYGWTQQGTPRSVTPLVGQSLDQLPIRAGPGYPVGNPGSDSTYTLWQPGIVAGPQVFAGAAAASTDDLFVTQFPAWIPNGQYATMMVAGVSLPSPNVDTFTNSVPTLATDTVAPTMPLPATLMQVPARDAALIAVQRLLGPDGWTMVAWNTLGTVLASVSCSNPATPSLQLRETENGSLVGNVPLALAGNDAGCSTLNTGVSLGSYANPNLTMQWSPDGSHLLLSDQTSNTVTLWHVAALPTV